MTETVKRQKKILLIDDDLDLLEVIKTILETNDYGVVTASDGERGLEKAKSEKPDLILLDILMPKMDGYTFMRRMKTNEAIRDIPVIVVSGKTKMKDLFKIEGVRDYLVKPYDSEQLLGLIKKYLI